MSLGLPQPTVQQICMPNPSRAALSLTTTAPTVIGNAHGKVLVYGSVMVEVDTGCTVTIYLWSHASNSWVLPSSASASYQKTFAGAGMDYFLAPPGALFYLKLSASTATAYTDALLPNGNSH
jgi:hypothetical protein